MLVRQWVSWIEWRNVCEEVRYAAWGENVKTKWYTTAIMRAPHVMYPLMAWIRCVTVTYVATRSCYEANKLRHDAPRGSSAVPTLQDIRVFI